MYITVYVCVCVYARVWLFVYVKIRLIVHDRTCVGPLALTNDKIYGPSNVCGPLRDRYDFQTL